MHLEARRAAATEALTRQKSASALAHLRQALLEEVDF